MINILHIINGWPSGGIAEQTYLICKHLPKDKFKQYSIGYCHFDGEFVKKFEDVGVSCLRSDKFYSNLREIIEEHNIHIVHKQTGGGDFPSYVFLLKRMGIPLVETLHCPRATGIPIEFIERIIYTTLYTKNKNHHDYFDKMTQIQYALDIDKPFEKTEKGEFETIKVGRLGRIVMDKRPDVVLAVAELCLNHYGPDVEFHLAGMIPTDYEYHIEYGKKFKGQVEELKNVTYHGFVENKYDFWKTLDICINPVWETSFDIVFLEAMACGIPIVTWDNSAAKYVVGNAGVITEENVLSLYEGLRKLIDGPDKHRELLGEIGKKYIEGKYSLESFKRSYERMYEEIWEKHYS